MFVLARLSSYNVSFVYVFIGCQLLFSASILTWPRTQCLVFLIALKGDNIKTTMYQNYNES